MKEALTKTSHDMGFACDDLREALSKSGNVESIVVLDLIGRANELRRDVEALLNALKAEEKIVEMALCEVDHISLRPNSLYRFIVMPDCEACARLDIYDKKDLDNG